MHVLPGPSTPDRRVAAAQSKRRNERATCRVTDEIDVQVSLVNTNNRDLLRKCLASIPAACDGLSWKATVVENASADGSAEMVRNDFPWARLIENDRRLGF